MTKLGYETAQMHNLASLSNIGISVCILGISGYSAMRETRKGESRGDGEGRGERGVYCGAD